MNETTATALTAAALVAVVALLLYMTWVIRSDTSQLEAVLAGHAEYYLDTNHVRQWRWKQH